MIDESRWPFDPVGYVFLARAVNELGAACWGEQWNGKELACGTALIDTSSAFNLLWSLKRLPKSHPLQPEFSSLLFYENRLLATWEHLTARLKAHSEFTRVHDASRRLKHVQDWTARLFEAGILKSFMRPVVGGALDPMPEDWWRSESLHVRFHDFQVDAWAPFGSTNLRKDLRWIFVSSESLAAAVNGILAEKYELTCSNPFQATVAPRISNGPAMRAAMEALAVLDKRREPFWDWSAKELLTRVEDVCAELKIKPPGGRILDTAKKAYVNRHPKSTQAASKR